MFTPAVGSSKTRANKKLIPPILPRKTWDLPHNNNITRCRKKRPFPLPFPLSPFFSVLLFPSKNTTNFDLKFAYRTPIAYQRGDQSISLSSESSTAKRFPGRAVHDHALDAGVEAGDAEDESHGDEEDVDEEEQDLLPRSQP